MFWSSLSMPGQASLGMDITNVAFDICVGISADNFFDFSVEVQIGGPILVVGDCVHVACNVEGTSVLIVGHIVHIACNVEGTSVRTLMSVDGADRACKGAPILII